MDFTFKNYLGQCINNPILLVISFLILGVVFANGWIDAPNSIATCISTKSINPKKALVMSGIFSFLGIFVMSYINSSVAETVYNIVNLGDDITKALLAIGAGMLAIIIWSIVSWKFEIPTSQSHSLVASISGAGIAIQNGLTGINIEQWKKVFLGLFFSVFLGFICGFFVTKIIEKIFRRFDRRKIVPVFKKTNVLSGAIMSFMNGAQDGQKFIGLFLLGFFLLNNSATNDHFYIPVWIIILFSVIITSGTFIGGRKMIRAMATKISKLEAYQGTASDLSAAFVLFISTVSGIPISSSHTKLSSIMGVGASKRLSNVNWASVRNMVLGWIITFPTCGIMGFLFTKIAFIFVN